MLTCQLLLSEIGFIVNKMYLLLFSAVHQPVMTTAVVPPRVPTGDITTPKQPATGTTQPKLTVLGSNQKYVPVSSPSQNSVAVYIILPIGKWEVWEMMHDTGFQITEMEVLRMFR